jgi:tetratricopeptide (TPR) repeat protein
MRFSTLILYLSLLAAPIWQAANPASTVRFTHGTLEVPTYTFGRSESVAPLFKSAESRGLYPYAALDRDSLSRRPIPVKYESLTLENEYLRIILLPELGGRIWSVRDKVANREIFYTAGVIKPTLYNQRGGWPAGNLEVYGPYDAHMLTWPGEPWPWAFRPGPDGSASVVLSHIDHLFRNKISMTVTLHPGRSFVELSVRLSNNNALANRYLLWTNAGVAATEGTRFVYPMTRTIAHVSSDIGTWPMAEGADLSWYKNNPKMLGVFGLDLYDNFIAAYDYKADHGVICYTNRQIARGVKTWTWGVGDAARRQMEHYTDADGPYLEVQSGRFVWDGNYEFIEPGKTDGWTEFWYGTGGLANGSANNSGGLTTATRDVAIGFDTVGKDRRTVRLAVRATGRFPNATLKLKAAGVILWTSQQNLSPEKVFRQQIEITPEVAGQALMLEVLAANGETLSKYVERPDGSHPDAVFASDSIPRRFGAIEGLTAEEAFQKGLSHEKFGEMDEARQAYEAALGKDRLFTQPHLRLGAIALEQLQYESAINHFTKVLERDPVNGEAHYHLAVAYSESGKNEESQRHYSRLLPAHAKYDQRDYGLGLLALRQGNLPEAAKWLTQAAAASAAQISVRQAYAYVLRKLNRNEEARKAIEAILELDPTNAFAYAELLVLDNPQSAFSTGRNPQLDQACAHHEQGYLELATEYLKLSAWQEAGGVLERGIAAATNAGKTPYPMLYYYRAFVADRLNDSATVRDAIAAARRQQLDLDIFPFRRESIQVLRRILAIEPKDANAACLLGDLLYYRERHEEAQAAWRKAVESDPHHFSALRDLGMSLLEAGRTEEALALLARATAERPDHLPTTLLVAELLVRGNQLGGARQTIEQALRKQPGNDRLLERLAAIETLSGKHESALRLLTGHSFEPRHQSYSLLHLYQAIRLMLALGQYRTGDAAAIDHVRAAQTPPANLGVDDFAALQSARLFVFEALLRQATGSRDAAKRAWGFAAGTAHEESDEEGLFRAIALSQEGKKEKAETWLKNFVTTNERNQNNNRAAVRAQSHYLAGIYAAFRGSPEQARENLRKCLDIDPSHLWARQALAWLEAGLLKHLTP